MERLEGVLRASPLPTRYRRSLASPEELLDAAGRTEDARGPPALDPAHRPGSHHDPRRRAPAPGAGGARRIEYRIGRIGPMTTQTSLVPPKIGQVRDAFVRSDPSQRLGPEDLSRLRRFVTWCGVSTSMEAVPPFKIEEFLAPRPRPRSPALHAGPEGLFAYALEQGMVESDPMRAVRLPPGAGSATKRSTSASSVAPPRARRRLSASPRATRIPGTGRALGRRRGRERGGGLPLPGAPGERCRWSWSASRTTSAWISQMLHEAIKDGDLSENAAYDDIEMRQGPARSPDQGPGIQGASRRDHPLSPGELLWGGGTERRAPGGGRLRGSAGLPGGGARGDQPPQQEDPPRSPVGRAILSKAAGDEVEVATLAGPCVIRS